MAYVLGFIAADGAIIDARKSSRTCYVTITIGDIELLRQIKKTLSSNHIIYPRKAHSNKFRKKAFFCKTTYTLRFGSKTMFQDLITLGITPRKSLRLKLPFIAKCYFPFFVRGYFDGDGCINISQTKNGAPKLQVIFTSGCKAFLRDLSSKLAELLQIRVHHVTGGRGTYRLRYKKIESLKLIKYMYQNLHGAPFLIRKYNKAKFYL